MRLKARPIRVCATCPWLRENQGKPHAAGWYKVSNLRRLWNGLRTGRAPGMVCHSSDAASVDYGSTGTVHPSVEKRHCAGALILVIKHVNECGQLSLEDYRKAHKLPLTKTGLAYWISRSLFGELPAVDVHRANEAGLPWEDQ